MKSDLFKFFIVLGFVCFGVYLFKQFSKLTVMATGLMIQNDLLISEVNELRGTERKVCKGFAPA